MATADSFGRAPAAGGGAVLVYRIDRVLAARGVIPALAAQQSAKRDAVQENELDQQPLHGGTSFDASFNGAIGGRFDHV